MDDLISTTYLLFGQAMPGLSSLDRDDTVDLINAGEPGVALYYLIIAIDLGKIPVDGDLLDRARGLNPMPALLTH